MKSPIPQTIAETKQKKVYLYDQFPRDPEWSMQTFQNGGDTITHHTVLKHKKTRKKTSNWTWRMVTTFKNTSYRWLREQELPVGARAKERVCMCVFEEWEEERGDEGASKGKSRKGEGGMGEGGGPVRNVNGEGVLGRVSVCVCTHRGVVLGEALMEKPWAPTQPPPLLLPSPASWSAHRHTHRKKKNQLDENTDRRCFSVVRMKLWNNVDMSIKMWNSFVVFKWMLNKFWRVRCENKDVYLFVILF